MNDLADASLNSGLPKLKSMWAIRAEFEVKNLQTATGWKLPE